MYYLFARKQEQWAETLWANLNVLFIFVLFICQETREQWAETLWANLNVQVLQDGIEGLLKSLRKLPRDVKNMPVGRILDEKMKEFRDSLPLFVDLKHEALRERYVSI